MATITQRGRKFQVQWGGRTDRQRKLVNTLAEAQRLKLEIEGRAAPQISAGMSLKELYQLCCREFWDRSKDSRNSKARALEAVTFFGEATTVVSITPLMASEYSSYLFEEMENSPATVNRKVSALSKMLTRASDLRIGFTSFRIPRHEEDGARTRVISFAEEDAILKWCAANDPLLGEIVTILIDLGLRCSELLNANWPSVQFNLDVPCFQVRGGKTKASSRDVPLTARVLALLRTRHRATNQTRIIGLTYHQLRHRWAACRDALGFGEDREFVLHVLRHTYGTRLGEAGTDPLRIQRLMGHSSLATTGRYVKTSQQSLKDEVDKLDQARRRAGRL